jgi:hypothetical protein
MSAPAPLDDATMKYGLLLETAQTQQKLIASGLRQLKSHTQGLDAVVREQIRCTLVEELGAVVEQSTRTVDALRTLERAAHLRLIAWTLALTGLSGLVTGVSAWWLLPRPAQIEAMRAQREQLAVAIETLEKRGGLIDLRRCGSEQRWCARIDRQAPAYGGQSDYMVLKGY